METASTEQTHNLSPVLTVAVTLSFISAVAVLIVIYWLKIQNKLTIYLNFLFLTSALFSGVSLIVVILPKGVPNESVCSVLTFLRMHLSNLTIYWTTSFAFSLYILVVREEDPLDYRNRHLIIGNALSLLVSVPPLFYNGYGVTNYAICGFSDKLSITGSSVTRIYTQYASMAISFVVVGAYFRGIVRYLQSFEDNERYRVQIRSTAKQFLPYQLIIFVCGFPGFVAEIVRMSTGKELELLQEVVFLLFRLNGFFNALVYVFTKSVRQAVVEKIKGGESIQEASLSMSLQKTVTETEEQHFLI